LFDHAVRVRVWAVAAARLTLGEALDTEIVVAAGAVSASNADLGLSASIVKQ
jgi:hypothetical protein